MYKPALVSGALLAMLAVIFGAFGAHYLKTIFTPELLSSFETGVRYQFYHAFALLFVGLYAQQNNSKQIRTIFLCFLLGVILFSGSIYLLCFLKSADIIGLSGIGILTPMGGVCFIAGWLLLLMSVLKKK
jgi:uncharacterized membrane protein YgdD (TMEM256/DUF423 family)